MDDPTHNSVTWVSARCNALTFFGDGIDRWEEAPNRRIRGRRRSEFFAVIQAPETRQETWISRGFALSFSFENGNALVSPRFIRSLITLDSLKHGSRSVELLMKMCLGPEGQFRPPAKSQLEIHLSPQEAETVWANASATGSSR